MGGGGGGGEGRGKKTPFPSDLWVSSVTCLTPKFLTRQDHRLILNLKVLTIICLEIFLIFFRPLSGKKSVYFLYIPDPSLSHAFFTRLVTAPHTIFELLLFIY